MTRALIVTRLSRTTEASTSIERQKRACRKLCRERGYDVVDVVEDPDVSAATKPFDRPKLGPWLTDRHPEYDVIVVYRMDRLVRRLLDLADLISWGQQHDVAIVSATEAFLDLTAPFGDIVAMLVAKVAEMELEAIRERNAGAFAHNIRAGKWRGGVPPWGYLPARDDDGVWRLVPDPEQVAVISEVVDRVLAGETLRAIARDLTHRQVPTPRDRFAIAQGRKPSGAEWHPSPLKRGLTSKTLLGQVITRDAVLDASGKPKRDAKGHRVLGAEYVVTGDDGRPVQRAEPVLTRKLFDRVGRELARREVQRDPTTRSGLLLQVLFCGECGHAAYRLKGGPGRQPRYRCGSAQTVAQCDNRSVALVWADEQVEANVLGRLGSMERMRRVWHVGNDTSDERAEVDELLTDLTDQLGTGVYRRGTPQRARLDARIQALSKRQRELAAAPVEAAGWVYEGTGETVAEWWAAADSDTRTAWLRDMGVRATWRSHTEGGRTTVDEFTIEVGAPDLDGAVLPAAVADMAALQGAWSGDPDGRGLPELLAQQYWREGDKHGEALGEAEGDPTEGEGEPRPVGPTRRGRRKR